MIDMQSAIAKQFMPMAINDKTETQSWTKLTQIGEIL
jgi:hypothetical protein